MMLEQSASHAMPGTDKADRHWKEVMDMAEQYGFITQVYRSWPPCSFGTFM